MSVFACLGSEAVAVRDAFVQRLRSHVEVRYGGCCEAVYLTSFPPPHPPSFPPSLPPSSSPVQDVELKVAIVELVTECVHSQPGMMELFLSIQPAPADSATKVS